MALRRRHILLFGAACGLPAAPALADTPGGGRPVRLVVPFPPGGAADITGCLLAERLGPALGTTVVVENRAGAGGNIGADAVAKAPLDGGTVGLVGVSTLCAAPSLYRNLPFDPQRDLAPVSAITTGGLLCALVRASGARLD